MLLIIVAFANAASHSTPNISLEKCVYHPYGNINGAGNGEATARQQRWGNSGATARQQQQRGDVQQATASKQEHKNIYAQQHQHHGGAVTVALSTTCYCCTASG